MAHILDEDGPRTSSGWCCPGCGRGYNPKIPICHYCPVPDGEHRASVQPITFAPVPPRPADVFAIDVRLPGEWSQPRYVRVVRAGGEWREVTPGLQVMLGQPIYAGDEAVLHFRLTPLDGAP